MFGEHDRQVHGVLLPCRVDKALGKWVANDGEGPAFTVRAALVLGPDHAIKRAGGRQRAETGRCFRPDHAMAEARVMGRLGQIRERAHARAVRRQSHDLAARQVLHAVGIRIGPSGRLALDRVRGEAPALRKRLVILVAPSAVKQHHVTGAQRSISLLPAHDAFLFDQVAAAVGGGIDQVAAVDHTGLAAKLPCGDSVGERATERAGVAQSGLRQGHGVRRDVHLGARVSVNDQDVAVVRAERPDALVMVDLETRPGGPGARVFRRHQQRKIDETRLNFRRLHLLRLPLFCGE